MCQTKVSSNGQLSSGHKTVCTLTVKKSHVSKVANQSASPCGGQDMTWAEKHGFPQRLINKLTAGGRNE